MSGEREPADATRTYNGAAAGNETPKVAQNINFALEPDRPPLAAAWLDLDVASKCHRQAGSKAARAAAAARPAANGAAVTAVAD